MVVIRGFVFVVQLLSWIQLFVTLCTAAHQASVSFTISWTMLSFMSTESVMPSNHHNLCQPLLLLPSIFSSIKFFPNKLAFCIRWPKYCSFSFNISPSNEYSGLISFRTDLFYLLVVQRILKSLLQHQNLKASILQSPAFFMIQLSHLYMTTGKTIVLIKQIFVSKMMSLLFNMLSRFVITFLLRNKRLLISWL